MFTLLILAFELSNLSLCLFALTTSLAKIFADFTSFFFASCFSSILDLWVAISSCYAVNVSQVDNDNG